MVKEQSKFFKGLGFQRYEFQYGYGKEVCYKGSDNRFYRIDHFSSYYVIECAENEEEAKVNWFEDTELYDDSLPEEQLIAEIQHDLLEFSSESC